MTISLFRHFLQEKFSSYIYNSQDKIHICLICSILAKFFEVMAVELQNCLISKLALTDLFKL